MLSIVPFATKQYYNNIYSVAGGPKIITKKTDLKNLKTFKELVKIREKNNLYQKDAEKALEIATEHYFKKYPSIE